MRAVGHLRQQTRCERIWLSPQTPAPEAAVVLADWQNPAADAQSFDRLLNSVRKEGRFRLLLWTRDWLVGAHTALEVLNRYQRWLPLTREQQLPELHYASDQALDVWRWLMRLKPTASHALQRAALVDDEAAKRNAQASDGLRVLRDAADISFFSLGSWQYLRTWGEEQTECMVERRLGRMSDEAICLALGTRQPPAVSKMIDACLDLPSDRGSLARMS